MRAAQEQKSGSEDESLKEQEAHLRWRAARWLFGGALQSRGNAVLFPKRAKIHRSGPLFIHHANLQGFSQNYNFVCKEQNNNKKSRSHNFFHQQLHSIDVLPYHNNL